MLKHCRGKGIGKYLMLATEYFCKTLGKRNQTIVKFSVVNPEWFVPEPDPVLTFKTSGSLSDSFNLGILEFFVIRLLRDQSTKFLCKIKSSKISINYRYRYLVGWYLCLALYIFLQSTRAKVFIKLLIQYYSVICRPQTTLGRPRDEIRTRDGWSNGRDTNH